MTVLYNPGNLVCIPVSSLLPAPPQVKTRNLQNVNPREQYINP